MFSDRGVDVGGLTFGKGRMRFSLEIVEGRPSLVVRGSENYQTVVFDLGKINIRPVAGDPASPTDGDIWYDDTAGLFQFRQEGVTESLSGDNAPVDATYVVSSANATLTAELVLGTDVIMAGLAAARPAAGTAGRLYYSTDTGVLERDSGATWVDITTTPDSHDHGSTFHSGLTDDDHTQYALLAGRSSSQLLRGGTGASETLTLRGTSHATVGLVALNDLGGHVTVGGGTAASELRILEPSGGGTSYTSFKSPALAANVDYTLPPDDGDAGEQLQTDGAGVLTWEAAGTGATPFVPPGRLTLTSATPVLTADAADQTTIYYALYEGDQIALYGGSTWAIYTLTELSIAMAASANWAANSNFDCFVYNDGGTRRLVTGPAWTSDTGRGTGAGTTELVRLNGLWTNAVSMTGRYAAASTVTVGISQGLYVGTIRTTGATGTTTFEVGGSAASGNPVRIYLWNMYNRVRQSFICQDTADSWTESVVNWSTANASTTNRATFVRGLNEDGVTSMHSRRVANAATAVARPGIGLDSTSTPTHIFNLGIGSASLTTGSLAYYSGIPGLGLHYLQALDSTDSDGVAVTYYGDVGTSFDFGGLTVDLTY